MVHWKIRALISDIFKTIHRLIEGIIRRLIYIENFQPKFMQGDTVATETTCKHFVFFPVDRQCCEQAVAWGHNYKLNAVQPNTVHTDTTLF